MARRMEAIINLMRVPLVSYEVTYLYADGEEETSTYDDERQVSEALANAAEDIDEDEDEDEDEDVVAKPVVVAITRVTTTMVTERELVDASEFPDADADDREG